MTQPSAPVKYPSDLPALLAAFLLVVGFTFSDDVVEFFLDVTGHSQAPSRAWLVFALDLLLVLGTAALKWAISGGDDLTSFVRRLCTGMWGLGAVLVIGGHLLMIATESQRRGLSDTATVWISLAYSAVFVAALTLLLLSALGGGTSSRSWVVPFVFGSLVVQVTTALWYPVIDSDHGCAGDISSTYFSDMTNILPIILLTLALELNYVRRGASVTDPGRRVAPVFIVIMLCIGEGLAFSMLVRADMSRCGLGAVWHEYIAFVVTAQALAIGLATMVWLLVVDAMDSTPDPGSSEPR